MRRALPTLAVFAFLGCEGFASELGESTFDAPQQGTIRDLSGPRIVDFSCGASTIETRAPLRCAAQASHPTAEALSCELSFDDARASVALGDCTALATTEVRTSAPGPLRLTLKVTDAAARATSRSLVVQVTGLPNQPPVVSSLSASALSGKAPLATTVRWTHSDPEGDALSCALDVGADGTVEYPAVDCAASSWPIAVRTPGTTPVRLLVTDPGGLTTQAVVTLEVLPPTADVRLERVEFGQTVVKESLTLVADKAALLRVVVLANEPGLSAAVDVEATAGATVLGRERLTGPAVVPQAEAPGDLAQSFRFTLPAAWVVAGVALRVRLDADEVLPEANEGNNELTVRPTVGAAREVHLTSVPVVNGGQTGQALDLDGVLTSLWPIVGVEAKVRAPFTWTQPISPTDTNSWAALLGGLAQAKASDGSDRNYYGWVRATFGGGVAGIGYLGQGVGTGRDDSSQVAAHELGHNFGRNHAPCGGAAGTDPAFPYAGARLGTWGWTGSRLVSPTQSVDLMSYCNPVWVSDYTYEGVQRFMQNRDEFDVGAMLPAVLGQDVLMLAGRVTPRGTELADPQRFHGAPSLRVEAGDATVVLALRGGAVLRVPVSLVGTGDADEEHFVTVVPTPGELVGWALERGGVELAARRDGLDDFAPAVTLAREAPGRVRVRWSGARSVLVAHVAPGGERTTLTAQATGGDVLLHTDGLTGDDFEVSLSNGVRSVARPFVAR